MAERLANIGYLAFGKETTPGVAVTPTFFVPLYEESMETQANFQRLGPIVGHKFATNQTIPGMRSHGGEVTIQGDLNAISHLLNMFLAKGTTTGTGPYVHPYSVNTTTPASYTVDVYTGSSVKRFTGVQSSKIAPDYDDNELRIEASLHGLGSFLGRKIASITGSVVTLSTDYDPEPAKGLVASDLVRLTKEGSSTILDTTISSINAAKTEVTLAAAPAGFVPGDMLTIRGQTPTYNNLQPLRWDKTLVGFGATAAAALSNATYALQTRVEQGSNWTLIHDFENDEGSARSGSRDPAVLVRTTADAELTIKKHFDTPEEVRRFNSLEKVAVVFRHLAGDNNEYELTVTFNHCKVDKPIPAMKAGEINYAEIEYIINQDTTDGQAVGVSVTNALATV